MQLLQDCNPAVLEALRAALGKVTEPEFTYDIDYAASFLGWEELRHAPRDANGGLDAEAQDRSSQGHTKVCVLLTGNRLRCVLHIMRLLFWEELRHPPSDASGSCDSADLQDLGSQSLARAPASSFDVSQYSTTQHHSLLSGCLAPA